MGYYLSEEDAAHAVDAFCVQRGLPAINAAVLSGAAAPIDKTPSSIYSGVTWYKPSKKWRAQIRHKGKKMCVCLPLCPSLRHRPSHNATHTSYLGYYLSALDAARAADAAWESHGLPRRNTALLAATSDVAMKPPDRPRRVRFGVGVQVPKGAKSAPPGAGAAPSASASTERASKRQRRGPAPAAATHPSEEGGLGCPLRALVDAASRLPDAV